MDLEMIAAIIFFVLLILLLKPHWEMIVVPGIIILLVLISPLLLVDYVFSLLRSCRLAVAWHLHHNDQGKASAAPLASESKELDSVLDPKLQALIENLNEYDENIDYSLYDLVTELENQERWREALAGYIRLVDRTNVRNDSCKLSDYATAAARTAEKLGMDKQAKEFRRTGAEAHKRFMNAPVYNLIFIVLIFAAGSIGLVLFFRYVLILIITWFGNLAMPS
jgi:hypothetical protein